MNRKLMLIPILVIAGAALPFAAHGAPVKLGATLNGANEPGGGDADGTGAFNAEIDAEAGDFCYLLTVARTQKPTAAHLHTGAAGVNGAPLITVEVTGANDDMCIAVEPDVLKAILGNPAGYYVNVHTPDFPAGAVRGQLAAK